jgi:hypothetical protein
MAAFLAALRLALLLLLLLATLLAAALLLLAGFLVLLLVLVRHWYLLFERPKNSPFRITFRSDSVFPDRARPETRPVPPHDHPPLLPHPVPADKNYPTSWLPEPETPNHNANRGSRWIISHSNSSTDWCSARSTG